MRRTPLLLLPLLLLLACGSGDEPAPAPTTAPDETGAAKPGAADSGASESGAGEPGATDTEAPLVQGDSREAQLAAVARIGVPFKGDLPEILERRYIRVLVTPSKTNYFFVKGMARGYEYELLREYEKSLNSSASRRDQQIEMVFIALPFNRLLPALAEGRGDIAAAGFTATAERSQLAAFTDPYQKDVSEVVVSSGGAALESLEDLAGQTIYVRNGSSYAGHLADLSRELVRQGLAPIQIVEPDADLATEDILELVNAGIIDLTVADKHIAEAWSGVMPNLKVRSDLVVSTGGGIAWAVRHDNPKLLADLNDFVRGYQKGTRMGNIFFKRYYSQSQWVGNPVIETERQKLEKLIPLFQKYADMYGFDWLALAAQAYQESGLDNDKVSRAGAVGIMQIKPSTAADKSVGITDIKDLENNIHAGTKYMAFLRDRYFSDPAIEAGARVDLAWAAYNAGPGAIARARKRTGERGFDPNRWFFNVEKVVQETVSREPVEYVASINKYYVAYRLAYEANRRRESKLRELEKKRG